MKRHPNEYVFSPGYKPNEKTLKEEGYSKRQAGWVKIDGDLKHRLVLDKQRNRWCLRTERKDLLA